MRQSYVQKEHSLGPKRKTNVIVHWLSLRQPSLTNWLMVSLPVSLPPHSLSACSVCSGGQWHSSKWGPVQPRTPPPPAPPFCTHGYRLCHQVRVRRGLRRAGRGAWGELEGEASTRVHSGWEGAGKRGTNTAEIKWRKGRAGGINRGRTIKRERRRCGTQRRKRKTKNEQEWDGKKKSDHPFWKLEGW